jgi:D-lactate dehydrogenase (cytochrome)
MIIKTSPDEIQSYLVDASNLKGYCDAVYIPDNKDEICEILKEANAKKLNVTISGNGTGLSGARVPLGGIVISTENLNKIIEINTKEMYAVVEPGVILSDLQTAVNKLNLLYPPDPTETNCFIGGNIATNASGEKTFKYGPTRNYVMELEIILPNGELLNLQRERLKADGFQLQFKSDTGTEYNIELPEFEMPKTKNASGYYCKKNMDAIDLFIGSEGTLGIVTKIKLKLIPLPENIISSVIFFNDELNALSFVKQAREFSYASRKRILKNSIDALALEFFDERSLNFLRGDYQNIPPGAKAAIWFEQETNESNEESLLHEWMKLVSNHNGDEESAWFAVSDSDKKKIKEFRHSISLKVADYLSKNNVKKLGSDAAVPGNKLEKFYFFAKNELSNSGFNYIAYGHIGNSHLHINMLAKDEDEYLKGKDLYKNIYRKAIELGGTISAEHGIGKLKTEYLIDMYGENVMNKMSAVKKTLDPNLILGKGNIFKNNFD